jgi:hypothetical protein
MIWGKGKNHAKPAKRCRSIRGILADDKKMADNFKKRSYTFPAFLKSDFTL